MINLMPIKHSCRWASYATCDLRLSYNLTAVKMNTAQINILIPLLQVECKKNPDVEIDFLLEEMMRICKIRERDSELGKLQRMLDGRKDLFPTRAFGRPKRGSAVHPSARVDSKRSSTPKYNEPRFPSS